MEFVALIALVIYFAFVVGTAILLRRRAPSRGIWIALVPGLNVLAFADLTGITHSHRFDPAREGNTRGELDQTTARSHTVYWR